MRDSAPKVWFGRAAYHLEHGERLSLGEVAAMADAMGMSYGAYSLQLSQQKHNVATN